MGEGGRWLKWHHHTPRGSRDREVVSLILPNILDTMWFQCPQETLLAWEFHLERKSGSSPCHGFDRFTYNVTCTGGTL